MESYLAILQTPAVWLSAAAVLGLLVGSFLNVVVARLPVMMEHEWRDECALLQGNEPAARPAFNLAVPRSHCPHCGQTLAARDLVPVLSWLWLRGRCRHCQAGIGWRYPVIELATAGLFVACAATLGVGMAALAAMAYVAVLLALAAIDLDTMFLPDTLTQPLLWGGLVLALTPWAWVSPADAVAGAAAGYGALWLVGTSFRVATGKEGMGQGDMKLLAAMGAWLGWQSLPGVVLVASLAGVAGGLALRVAGRLAKDEPLPFGPCLAGAGLLALFWPDMMQWWR